MVVVGTGMANGRKGPRSKFKEMRKTSEQTDYCNSVHRREPHTASRRCRGRRDWSLSLEPVKWVDLTLLCWNWFADGY
ncbi:hypothetical protein J6590_027224 [Homalodisca vitripennis]|nr:hypothetical protein J6590_027224 [Homalodisca vitripennis]